MVSDATDVSILLRESVNTRNTVTSFRYFRGLFLAPSASDAHIKGDLITAGKTFSHIRAGQEPLANHLDVIIHAKLYDQLKAIGGIFDLDGKGFSVHSCYGRGKSGCGDTYFRAISTNIKL